MAKNSVLQWDTTAANNTDIGGIGIQGGNLPSNFDNALREGYSQTAKAITRQVAKAAGSYTPALTDHNQFWRCTGAVTLNLTAAATLTTGWCLYVRANGGAVTIDPNGAETIDGSATLVVPDGRSVLILCDGTGFYTVMSGASPANFQIARTAGGRLTLTTATPVTVGDVTGASTIYYTPHKDNIVWLYDGSAWKAYAFSELSLVLSGLTSGKPYDVFLYDNAGTLTLELLVWTNDTTRATALVRQDGVWCKTGALTRRYVGTIYTTSTTTTEDSKAKRFVFNADNRAPRAMIVKDTTDTWNYTTATIRQANGAAANQLDFVRGLDEDMAEATTVASAANTGSIIVATNIGLDSTTTRAADSTSNRSQTPTGGTVTLIAQYRGFPGVGRHFLAWLEYSTASGTTTWYGDDGSTLSQAGISGTVMA